jgi:hypothetical protein
MLDNIKRERVDTSRSAVQYKHSSSVLSPTAEGAVRVAYVVAKQGEQNRCNFTPTTGSRFFMAMNNKAV